MVAVASLVVEAAAWRKRDFRGGGSALGSAWAAWRRQWQCSGGSGSAVAGSLATAVAAWWQQLGGSCLAAAQPRQWQRQRRGSVGSRDKLSLLRLLVLIKVFQFGIDCLILHTQEFSSGKKSYSLGISIFYIHT